MEYLYEAPFMIGHEKTAGPGGINKIAFALVADPDTLVDEVFSDSDLAYAMLNENYREKLACGIPLDDYDVNTMSETDVAALTVLGDDAMEKCATYDGFYSKVAQAEQFGRDLAREVFYAEQVKQAQEQQFLSSQAAKLASDPGFRQRLAKRAQEELAVRKGEKDEKKKKKDKKSKEQD